MSPFLLSFAVAFAVISLPPAKQGRGRYCMYLVAPNILSFSWVDLDKVFSLMLGVRYRVYFLFFARRPEGARVIRNGSGILPTPPRHVPMYLVNLLEGLRNRTRIKFVAMVILVEVWMFSATIGSAWRERNTACAPPGPFTLLPSRL